MDRPRLAAVFTALALIAFCRPSLRADDEDDLAKAARSPYRIESYVQSHTEVAWGELWGALPISKKQGKPAIHDCEERDRCSTDIVWLRNERDAVLRISNENWQDHVFLRFDRDDPLKDAWRFQGYYEPENIKAFEIEYRIVTVRD